MSTFATTLQELGQILDDVGDVVPAPIGTIIEVSAVVLTAAGKVVRTLDAAELERIRQSRALGKASGEAAHSASKNAGKR